MSLRSRNRRSPGPRRLTCQTDGKLWQHSEEEKKRFGFGLHESAGMCVSLWGSDRAGRRGWLFLSVSVCFQPPQHTVVVNTEPLPRWFDSVFSPIYWFFQEARDYFQELQRCGVSLEPSPPAVCCTLGILISSSTETHRRIFQGSILWQVVLLFIHF